MPAFASRGRNSSIVGRHCNRLGRAIGRLSGATGIAERKIPGLRPSIMPSC